LTGYLLGHWTCGTFCYDKGILSDPEKLYEFERSLLEVPSYTIAAEVSAFYIETGRLEYPLYIVIHIRNMRTDLPEWSDLSTDIYP
jgi:hypothetical protein